MAGDQSSPLASTLNDPGWLTRRYQQYVKAIGKEQGVISLIQEDLAELGLDVDSATIRKQLEYFGISQSGHLGVVPGPVKSGKARKPRALVVVDQPGSQPNVRRHLRRPLAGQPLITPSEDALMEKWGLNRDHARQLRKVISFEVDGIAQLHAQQEAIAESSVAQRSTGVQRAPHAGREQIPQLSYAPELYAPSAERRQVLGALEARIGISFRRIQFLDQALTHSSFVFEAANHRGLRDYEDIEFFGDSVIGMAVSHYLVAQYNRRLNEGQLTYMRAAAVRTTSLAAVARQLGLLQYLRCSKGQERELLHGEKKDRILASTFEALVGAIHLDQGVDVAQNFVLLHLGPALQSLDPDNPVSLKDPKGLLQEFTQATYGVTPEYSVVREIGPDNLKEYQVAVVFNGKTAGIGEGVSKKEAEENAARAALQSLPTPAPR